jgi:ABC-type Zn uptake system ZnuABC Zn-binding protein ZnuA
MLGFLVKLTLLSRHALGFLILLFLADGVAAENRLRVLASFFPPAVVALNVAGTNADVEILLDGRVDPHDFQFSRRDLAKITRADLLVLNGLGMESWLGRALLKVGVAKPKAELSTDLGPEQLIPASGSGAHRHSQPDDHDDAEFNPHIWLDPRLLAHGTTNVLRALQKADPNNAAIYAANARAFIEGLQELDAELLRGLAPVRQAPVVTWHDAFAYFARRYGPNVIGVIEPVAEVDPAPRYLAELSRRCRAGGVRALFDQPGVRSRLLQRLASDWQVPVATLDTLENQALKPDAYITAMRANARILRETLP